MFAINLWESTMKKISINVFNNAVLPALLAVIISAASIAQPYQSETFAVNNDVRVEVETSGGSIEVKGSNSGEVSVEMYVKRRGRTVDPGDADLSDYNIRIEKQGNTVFAIADRRGRNWGVNNISISFVVRTPTRATTDLKTSGGSIVLENLIGDQNAKTSGGSINASQVGGDIDLKTSGGTITIKDIEGRVDANTSGGRIRAENVSGGIIAKTSGGSISLDRVSGNVEAKTSGGSIDAEVLYPEDYIELKTSGGSITVAVPKDKGYDIDLDGNRVRADLENFSGEYERDEIEGSLNGGGIRVSARTSGGSVTLRYL